MDKDVELLNGEEQSLISQAIFLLVKECPAIPSQITVKYGDITNNCIAIFAVPGATVKKRYINGTFIGQFPFILRYRSKPTTNEDRIQREETLNTISKWLSGEPIKVGDSEYVLSEYPQITDDRKIQEIEQSQTAFIVDKADDGTVDHQVQLRLEYKKKGM